MVAVRLVQPVKRVQRKARKPTHYFQLRTPPFGLQPFLLAPVLAGETLKNILLQARVVTDPINNPLIGWWKEYYFFYVKLRDLGSYSAFNTEAFDQTLIDMLMDPDASTASIATAAAVTNEYRSAVSQIPWTTYCARLCTEMYFRDRDNDETYATGQYTESSLTWSLAKVNAENAWHSAVTDAEFVVPSDPGVTIGADDVVTMRELDEARRLWEMQRNFGMTDLSFEDYQRSQGVSVAEETAIEGRPELIRYIKEWTYPANTVDPITGTPSSAVSWSIQERVDKDRFFREPGFVFGMTVARPKVYFSAQTSAMGHFLTDATNWLPEALRNDAYAGFKKFAAAAGPAPTQAAAYWIDLRDLFVHGDQFTNFTLSGTDAGLVAMPQASSVGVKYPSLTEINNLFKTTTVNRVREDGVAVLNFLGRVEDRTVRT